MSELKDDITEEDKRITLNLHKKFMELIGENVFPINPHKALFISSMATATTVASIMKSFGITDKKFFLDSFVSIVLETLNESEKAVRRMEFYNGKKISEGMLN